MSPGLIVFPASLGSIFRFSVGACPTGNVCVGPSAVPVVPGHSLACIQGFSVVTPCLWSLVVGAGHVLVCVTLGAWHCPWGALWGLPTPLAPVLRMLAVSASGAALSGLLAPSHSRGLLACPAIEGAPHQGPPSPPRLNCGLQGLGLSGHRLVFPVRNPSRRPAGHVSFYSRILSEPVVLTLAILPPEDLGPCRGASVVVSLRVGASRGWGQGDCSTAYRTCDEPDGSSVGRTLVQGRQRWTCTPVCHHLLPIPTLPCAVRVHGALREVWGHPLLLQNWGAFVGMGDWPWLVLCRDRKGRGAIGVVTTW